MSADEDFIKSYKLAGLVVGKKNNLTADQIPVVSPDEDGQIEDSGMTKDDLLALVNSLPEPAIANATGTADVTYSANEVTMINLLRDKINAILTALRNKDIIDT
jgi:hypothetical protein